MADRRNKFLIKRSNVPSKVPTNGDLLLGEMALNTADVILYTSGTTANSILPIGWDRIHRTGDTMDGNLIINGDLTVTGSTNIPDYFVTGGTFTESASTITLTRNDTTEIDIDISRTRQILDIYESGTTLSTGAYTDIPWDSTIIVDSDYTHSGSEITFNRTAYYEVTYSVSIDINNGGRKTSRSRIVIDTGGGYNELVRTGGNGYHRSTASGQDSISKTIRQEFTAGDKIKVQFERLTGTGGLITIAGDSNITINKITS